MAHVIRQSAAASLQVELARGVHSDYRETVEEIVGAGQELSRTLEKMGDGLVREVEVAFLMVVEKKEDSEESEIFLKVVKKKEDGMESEIRETSLVFNLLDDVFGEEEGNFY